MPVVSVTLPPEILRAVDRVAFRQHRSRSQMVALLLDECLKQELAQIRHEENLKNGQRELDTLTDDPKR
jgi:metal-responsive CopG/Arc/MetJ family transcriptional regulator